MTISTSHGKLQDLLATMRASASAAGAVGAVGAASTIKPVLKVPLPAMVSNTPFLPLKTSKEVLLHKLMGMVETRFGIYSSQQVEKKLSRIFQHTGMEEVKDWVRLMEGAPSDDSEWLSLVEGLTVHETYFYRDRPLMDMLSKDIFPRMIRNKVRRGQSSIHIWSAGCSSGEEAYNISMLLLQCLLLEGEATLDAAGLIRPHPRWQITVLGTDVSRQILRVARDGVYSDFGMGSFRSMPENDMTYFEACAASPEGLQGGQHYRVKSFIAKYVSFAQHNLLSGKAPQQGSDLILCRNVMIYFEEKTKRLVQDMFHRSIASDATLVLGGTDVLYSPERFQRQQGSGGAWYIKH